MSRCLAICLAAIAIAAADTVRFIPATPENTRMADGSPLPEKLESIGWKWLPKEGNRGVLESSGDPAKTASPMLITVTGLQSGAVYEVFGYFWADGFDGAEMNARKLLPSQFGCTLAELQTYDGPTPKTDDKIGSWMVAPGAQTGETYGYHAVIEKDQRLDSLDTPLVLEVGNARLVRARLGLSKADAAGTLPVFFAAYPYAKSCIGRSRIEGVAVRQVEHEGPLEMGWKAGTRLHLAIRAGDPVTVRRELEAGADVNGFDEENLTPLFYACGAEDPDLAKRLLEKGANPNLEGQSVLPLAAAATTGNEALVKLLLDHGAKVPMELSKDSGKLANVMHPAWLHPVIVAIRSDSVPVLKMLLESAPGLVIEKLYSSGHHDRIGFRELEVPKFNYVGDALEAQQWQMMAFLLQKGCPASKAGQTIDLMRLAVQAGDAALPAIDAMIANGMPPVRQTDKSFYTANNRHSLTKIGFYGLYHEDALNTAVELSRIGLVKRLLPMAEDGTANYQDALYTRALHAGNQEVIDLVRQQFPNVAPARWRPSRGGEAGTENADHETLRLFLPRTRPPKEKDTTAHPGRHLLAVVSSPNAEGPGAALAALASGVDGWTVVDRDSVEAALNEGNFSKPWQQGEHRISDLGDRLSADSIIIVNKIPGKEFSVYAFEVVEVATGLVVHREHLQDKLMKLDADLKELLDRSRAALDAAGRNERHEAVTLLAFTARGEMPNELALASQLRAAVQREVDSTPGMISLTRAQSSRLVEEQALQGKSQIWGAAHMVEGALSPAGEGRIKVTLRLETFRDDRSVKVDATAEGPTHDLAALAAEAWRKLFAGDGNADVAKERDAALVKKNAIKEAERLMREAEWLNAVQPGNEDSLAMAEAAMALGLPPEKAIPTQLDLLFRRITSLSKRQYANPHKSSPRDFLGWASDASVIPLDVADRISYDLPQLRALLHQTAYHINTHGLAILDGVARKSDPSWHAHVSIARIIQVLVHVRTALTPSEMNPGHREEFDHFCRDFDELTRDYFAFLKTLCDAEPNRNHRDALYGRSALRFKKDPPAYMENYLSMFGDVSEYLGELFPNASANVRRLLLERAMRQPEAEMTDQDRLALASARCIAGDGESGRQPAEDLLKLANDILVRGKLDYPNVWPATRESMDRHSCYPWFDMSIPRHGAGLIPSLVHNPRMAPDFRMRWNAYFQLAKVRNTIPHGNAKLKQQLSIQNYFASYDRMAGSLLEKRGKDGLLQAMESARLFELVSGYSCLGSIEKRFEKQLRQGPMQLNAEMMADLRELAGFTPGCVLWPMVDIGNPDILWMIYLTSSLESFEGRMCAQGLNQGYKDGWLVALDCRSGKMIHRINLKKAACEGLNEVFDMGNLLFHSSNVLPFAQTAGHVMLNVSSWTGEYVTACLVIDKKTGKAKALPKGSIIGKSRMAGGPVIGHGGHFYFLDDAFQQKSGMQRDIDNTYKLSLFRVDPETMKLTNLTEYGRRPSLTPFDDADRQPFALGTDNGRMAVYNEKIFAHLDPDSGTWQLQEGNGHSLGWKLYRRLENEYFGKMDVLQVDGKTSGWRMNRHKCSSDRLQFESNGIASVQVPVAMNIPEDYRKNTFFKIQETPKGGKITYKSVKFEDHANTWKLLPQVINQTEDSLVVTLMFGPNYGWQPSTLTIPQLPFIWKIPKQQVFKILRINQKSN